MAEAKKSVFEVLNSINVNKHTENKNGLTYLSWAWAWAEVKKQFPKATYTIYENEHGWNYFTDGKTCWVKTGVTIEDIEHIEYLPVMNYSNKSIPLGNVTSFDVNKAIQRSLTKAVARHGLGLYIYAGEDLPEDEKTGGTEIVNEAPAAKTTRKNAPKTEAPKQTTAVEHFPTRNAVVKICKKYNLDLKTICDMFGLTRQSKDEDFKDCLAILMEENGVKDVAELD